MTVFFPQLETSFHCMSSFELDGPWGKVPVSRGTWVSIHFLPKVMVEGQLCMVTLLSAACEPAKWSTSLLSIRGSRCQQSVWHWGMGTSLGLKMAEV